MQKIKILKSHRTSTYVIVVIESTIFTRNQRQTSTIGHKTKHTFKNGHFEEVMDTSTYRMFSKLYSCSLDIDLSIITE